MTSPISIPLIPKSSQSISASIVKHATSPASSGGPARAALGSAACMRAAPTVASNATSPAKLISGTRRPAVSSNGGNFAVGSTGKRVQFVREEIYAIAAVCRQKNVKTGKANPPKSSGRSVIGELIREAPRYFKHLIHQDISPISPRLLWGKPPEDLVEWYEGHVLKANTIKVNVQRKGKTYERGQRSTVPILLSAVASYPAPPNDDDPKYQIWKCCVVEWAKSQYGDCLISVCEHVDEGYGHVHCLAACPDAQSARTLHSGHSATDEAKAAGTPTSELGKVYRAALAGYQEDFATKSDGAAVSIVSASLRSLDSATRRRS